MTIKGLKGMILGLAIMLFGGFFSMASTGGIAGIGFIIVIIGLMIVFSGYSQDE
jgi:hypothetical protein